MALRIVPDPVAETSPTWPTSPTSPGRELEPAVLARASNGEREACRDFVACYERRVFTLCARLLSDHGAAEDAAQETFFKALRALPRFDAAQTTRPSTWLLTIATHQCFDELRKRRRRPTLLGGDVVDRAVGDHDSAASNDARAATQRVQHALAGLSDDHRAVFVWRILAERSVEETAAALGIDPGTVKSRLSRARDVLRAQLGGRA